MMTQNHNFTRKLAIMLAIAFGALGTTTRGGGLNVQGDLNVASNLTAQSVTLGGVTQTTWSVALAGGYKYVMVAEGTNDTQRGSNLQAAYTTATTLDPSSAGRVAVIVPPGSYNLGATGLVMNTSYVDLIGLVPAQMTTKQVYDEGSSRSKTIANVQCPVLIYANVGSGSGTIRQTVDNVRIESMILSNAGAGVAYYPTVGGTNTVMRHVSMSSMLEEVECPGLYVDCVGGDYSFGDPADGAFIDCVGGYGSFGGDGQIGI